MFNIYRDSLLLFLYCSLIFFLSHQPTLPVSMAFPHQDKLIHATAYAVMGILAWRCFIHLNKPTLLIGLIAVLFSSTYGVSDEFHQSFVVGRDADVFDWLADTIGAMIAVSVLTWRGLKDDCRC